MVQRNVTTTKRNVRTATEWWKPGTKRDGSATYRCFAVWSTVLNVAADVDDILHIWQHDVFRRQPRLIDQLLRYTCSVQSDHTAHLTSLKLTQFFTVVHILFKSFCLSVEIKRSLRYDVIRSYEYFNVRFKTLDYQCRISDIGTWYGTSTKWRSPHLTFGRILPSDIYNEKTLYFSALWHVNFWWE